MCGCMRERVCVCICVCLSVCARARVRLSHLRSRVRAPAFAPVRLCACAHVIGLRTLCNEFGVGWRVIARVWNIPPADFSFSQSMWTATNLEIK